jgi:hypothetical protein
MTAVQVHPIGTQVVVENHTIGTQYPGDAKPREVYSLNDEWLQGYRFCRVCNKPVNEDTLARAYWKHEKPVCSTECLSTETLKRYACCEKARPLGCVCTYSTTCPDHGDRHFGTHD